MARRRGSNPVHIHSPPSAPRGVPENSSALSGVEFRRNYPNSPFPRSLQFKNEVGPTVAPSGVTVAAAAAAPRLKIKSGARVFAAV